MKEKYNLFLDDMRDLDYIKDIVINENKWEIARSYDEFVDIIERKGIPFIISYDHDLCIDAIKEYLSAKEQSREFNYYRKPMEKTGMHCLDYLLEKIGNEIHPYYYIHSSNDIAAKRMREKITKHNNSVQPK